MGAFAATGGSGGTYGSGASAGVTNTSSGSATGSGSTSAGGSNGTGASGGATSSAGSAGTAGLPVCEPTAQSIHDTIIAPSCTSRLCHGSGAAAALDLSTTTWSSNLVGVSSSTCDGWARIVPGSPEQSFLYEKISKDAPACGGERMPSGAAALSDQYIQCVGDWIRSLAQGSCETCGGSSCVSLPTDPNHCGACDTVCPSGSMCESGACVCPGGQSACGSACVDASTDANNCGACGRICTSGALCNAGQCVCSGSLSACGNGCYDLTSDATHCGACGTACNAGEVCLAGKCSAGCGTLMQCGSSCVDVSSSATNCGSCGHACAAGLTCNAGACGCAAGLSACGSACVDVATDTQNCGACGVSCGPGSTCASGQCQCGATSVSFQSDVQPILSAACTNAGCHSGTRPKEGLSLEAGKAYAALVGVQSTECGNGLLLVKAGDAGRSYLMDKLLGANLCSGSQMPKAGQSLPSADLAKISDWICQGAKQN